MKSFILSIPLVFSFSMVGAVISVSPSTSSGGVGTQIGVDVRVSGLGSFTSPSLSAYSLDVSFDPSIISPTTVVFSTLLDLGFGSAQNATVGFGTIKIEELSFAPTANLHSDQPDDFVLATITFDLITVGASALNISNVESFDGFGDPLSTSVINGTVTVTDGVAAVPEPNLFASVALMLALLSFYQFRRVHSVRT